MKISKRELIEMDACELGLNRFIEQTNNTDAPVEATTLVGGENSYSDLTWLANKKLPADEIIRFACNCALINVELIKPYTDEYEVIVGFLNNPEKADATAVISTAFTVAHSSTARNVRNVVRAVFSVRNAACNVRESRALYAGNTARLAASISEESREKVHQLLTELLTDRGEEI